MNSQQTWIDKVIAKCVDEIWTKYDDDGNGFLDKQETKNFVMDTLKNVTEGGYNEDDFEQCFREFDKDGSGTIEKSEMATFIKQVAGF